MHKLKSILCLLVVLAMSCAATGCATTEKTMAPDFCATAAAIYINESDDITDATARQILAHNKIGVKLCGWGKKNG